MGQHQSNQDINIPDPEFSRFQCAGCDASAAGDDADCTAARERQPAGVRARQRARAAWTRTRMVQLV